MQFTDTLVYKALVPHYRNHPPYTCYDMISPVQMAFWIADILANLNHAVNFLLYAVASPQFREQLWALLRRRPRGFSASSTTTTARWTSTAGSHALSTRLKHNRLNMMRLTDSNGSGGGGYGSNYGGGVREGIMKTELESLAEQQTVEAELEEEEKSGWVGGQVGQEQQQQHQQPSNARRASEVKLLTRLVPISPSGRATMAEEEDIDDI